MQLSHPQVGLVLAGGGAKGAYQAGALKYLAEETAIEPKIIAGTSIGALNGAVLAAHQPFDHGVHRLNKLWDRLGDEPILRPHMGTVLKTLSYAAQTLIPTFQQWSLDVLVTLGLLPDRSVIFDPEPIEHRLREAVDLTELRQGVELWVTVFPALNIPGINYDLLMHLADLLRARTGTKAQWLCAQTIQDDETLYNLLLASAAIPLAFPQREVNGQFYVDGALTDNIPLGALAARGCTHAIVIHLDNGEIWNRHNFPEQTVIEIRPEQRINKFDTPILGSVSSLLDFSSDRIAELKRRGYQDAKRCLEPIIATFRGVQAQRQSHHSLVDSTQQLLDDSLL
ncbi:MAG TPA: patatin-like phospholipase family protein [Coleofasciculaceae cyanobacterium]